MKKLALLIGIGVGLVLAQGSNQFETRLVANWFDQAQTQGKGQVIAVLNADKTVTVSGTFRAMSGPAGAIHIHGPAKRDEYGPVMFGLKFQNKATGSGFIYGTTPAFSDNQIADLKEGRTFVLIHTDKYRQGELRGQLAIKRP